MPKSSGLGDNFVLGGFDLSGDVASVDQASGGPATLDVTSIKKSAMERIGGLRTGDLQFTTFWEYGGTANPIFAHDALSSLPRTDVIGSYYRGTATGSPAASCVARQVNYDPTRSNAGDLTMKVDLQSDAYGLEWGKQLTPGLFSVANALTGQNSGFEGGIGNWVLGTNSTVAGSSAQHHTGTACLAVTSAAGGDMTTLSAAAANWATQMFAVVPGNQVNVQAWVRSAVSARTCSVGIDWYTSAGSHISTAYGTGAADTTSGWTLITATLTAPATAAWAAVNVKVAATGAGSEVHYVDDVQYLLLPPSYDTGASRAFGGQAYLQVNAFTGTDATISIWDSADNVTFAAVTSFAFAQTTAAPTAQRIAIANTATIRRYVTASVATAGGYTALTFGVQLSKNKVAGVTF